MELESPVIEGEQNQKDIKEEFSIGKKNIKKLFTIYVHIFSLNRVLAPFWCSN